MSGAFSVVNPANEQVVATVSQLGAEEADAAIARAASAFGPWAKVAPADRARLLRRFAQNIDAARDELASLEVQSAGHTLSNARWEASNVRDVVDYYAAAPERLFGRQIPVAGGIDVTFREPLGVVGVIVPWNFPMVIASWGFAPALAAGNTVVVKPAQLTPLSALKLGELALEAGLPEGVFQVVTGSGADVGWRLVENESVRKVCFTGSTDVGKRVMAGCADQVKRITLELGGKSANVVFADSDLEQAAATAPYAVFDNAGQDCCARSRILVQSAVFDRFMELLEPAVKGVVVADPADEMSEMGPLISATHRAMWLPSCPTTHQLPSGDLHPRAPVTGTRPPSWPRSTAAPECFGRRSSAPSWPSYPSGTKLTPSRSPTTPPMACQAPYGHATWAERCGWPGLWRRGRSRSIRTHRCATARRSGDSSSQAWVASWVPMPSMGSRK